MNGGGLAALSLSLVANYPHFLLSYKLAYTRGRRFVGTHWWQLVLVPVSRLRQTGWREARAMGLAGGVVVAGWLAFEFLPGLADARLQTPDALGLPFFLVAATLFINIHHYFIDNVLWRFGDPQVRAYLLD